MRRITGFTLLEVLGALVLLGFLMMSVYAGIRIATHTVRTGQSRIEAFDQLRAAQRFLRHELTQALTQPITHDDKGGALFFVGNRHQMRFVAPLPGYLGRLGPQLQQVRLVPDGKSGFRLEVSLAILPPDGTPPQPLGDTQVLLSGIRSGTFLYRGLNPRREPGEWQDTWQAARQLPRLVAVELELDGGRHWPLLHVPLRVFSMHRGLQ